MKWTKSELHYKTFAAARLDAALASDRLAKELGLAGSWELEIVIAKNLQGNGYIYQYGPLIRCKNWETCPDNEDCRHVKVHKPNSNKVVNCRKIPCEKHLTEVNAICASISERRKA